jgi:rhodanese-related sulfurtransferase
MKTNQILALIAIAAGLLAAFTSHSVKNNLYPTWKFDSERVEGKKVDYISANHLADLLYLKEQGIVVLDVRSESEFNAYHIPSAIMYGKGDLEADQEKSTFIVYGLESDAEVKELKSKLPGKVYVLEGGMESWNTLVLFPDFNHFRIRNSDALEQIIRKCRYFGGTPGNTQFLNIDIRQTRYREGC